MYRYRLDVSNILGLRSSTTAAAVKGKGRTLWLSLFALTLTLTTTLGYYAPAQAQEYKVKGFSLYADITRTGDKMVIHCGPDLFELQQISENEYSASSTPTSGADWTATINDDGSVELSHAQLPWPLVLVPSSSPAPSKLLEMLMPEPKEPAIEPESDPEEPATVAEPEPEAGSN